MSQPALGPAVAAQRHLGSQEPRSAPHATDLPVRSQYPQPFQQRHADHADERRVRGGRGGGDARPPRVRRPEPEGFTGDVAAFYGVRASFERRVLRSPAIPGVPERLVRALPFAAHLGASRSTGPASLRVLRAVALGGLGRRTGAPGLGSPRGLQGRGRRAPRRAAPGGLAAAERGRRDRHDQRGAAPSRPRRGARARGPRLGRARRGGPGRGRPHDRSRRGAREAGL